MRHVALFEFDNVICDTLGYIRSSNIPFSFSNIDHNIQKKMKYHAYSKVMMYMLRNKGYSIEIYSRRKRHDADGVIAKKWLDENNFQYDKIHVIHHNDSIVNNVTGYTYLITTSVDDAKILNKYSLLSSATVVDCVINRKLQLPNYCDRLYYT